MFGPTFAWVFVSMHVCGCALVCVANRKYDLDVADVKKGMILWSGGLREELCYRDDSLASKNKSTYQQCKVRCLDDPRWSGC